MYITVSNQNSSMLIHVPDISRVIQTGTLLRFFYKNAVEDRLEFTNIESATKEFAKVVDQVFKSLEAYNS